VRAQHFTGAADLESLGHRFLRFNTFGTSHKATFVSKEREI
jgi:hypothetical protein